jgi:DNA-binding CsgD family transcriptional regulator
VHSEFLDPRGYIAGAATVIQGAGNCLIHTAIEGFSSHAAATGAINFLDGLRPHLARAISLTALRTDRSRVVVDSLNMGGVAAAVIGKSGRLRSVNDLFVGQMGSRMIDGVLGLRFTDQHLTDQLRAALQKIGQGEGGVQSIAMRGGDGLQPFAIHLLPIIGAAREVCDSDGILMLISEASNTSTPSADLLRLLFDLTPSEARVARHLMTGGTIVSAGKALGIGDGTVRSHLKGVFAKTRVNRQADLMRLLAAYGPPTSRS